MRSRVLIETAGHGLMNRDTHPSICVHIPSYSEPDTAFTIHVDDIPPELLEPMKVYGTSLTAIVGVGDEANEEHLAGRLGFYMDEPEPVSISDLELVAQAADNE
jgi:hypothetical protein